MVENTNDNLVIYLEGPKAFVGVWINIIHWKRYIYRTCRGLRRENYISIKATDILNSGVARSAAAMVWY